MKSVILRGSLPASLCPFRPDFSVDEEAFASHVRWLVDASKGGGVVCNGHAGEVASLTRKERKKCDPDALRQKGNRHTGNGIYRDS